MTRSTLLRALLPALRVTAVVSFFLASACTAATAAFPPGSGEYYHWPLDFEPVPVQLERSDLLTVFGDELVISGLISKQQWVGIRDVGRWDGAAWKPMGAIGIEVKAFASFDTQLVAGGTDLPGDGVTGALARWDGESWVRFGGDLEGDILSLSVWRGQLIIGGRFRVRGHRGVRNLIAWDGRKWRELPTDGLGGGENSVRTLAVHGDDLIVGGLFAEVDGIASPNVARYDGRRWHTVGGGTDGFVRSLVSHGGRLYAAGRFRLAGEQEHALVAVWDGATWHDVGEAFRQADPTRIRIWSLKSRNGLLYASGALPAELGGVATWDGQQWQPVGAPLGGARDCEIYRGQAVVLAPGNRAYPGTFEGCEPFALIRWTGENWQWLHWPSTGILGRDARMTLYRGELVIAGRLGPLQPELIEVWRGDRWQTLVSGPSSLVIRRLKSDGDSLYAFASEGWGVEKSRCIVLRWDGRDLRQLGPDLSLTFSRDARLTAGNGHVVLVGTRTPPSNTVGGDAGRPPEVVPVWSVFDWSGSTWNEAAAPPGCAAVTDAIASAAGLFVAGWAETGEGSGPLIWRRQEAGWRQVWAHGSGSVPFFYDDGRNLWAGVQGADSQDEAPPPLLRWEDDQWRPFGSPLIADALEGRTARVQAMAVYGGEPVIAARFRDFGRGSARDESSCLVWRNERWHRVADFLPDVAGLLAQGDRLWLAQPSSGPVSNLPLTFWSGPMQAGEALAADQVARWRDLPVDRRNPFAETFPSTSPVILSPSIPLPVPLGDQTAEVDDAWRAFEAGRPGWIGCPHSRARTAAAVDTSAAKPGSLTPLFEIHQMVGLNFRSKCAVGYRVGFRWRLTRQGVPLREAIAFGLDISLTVGDEFPPVDEAYRALQPVLAALDPEGFARASLTVATAHDSSLVRLKFVTRDLPADLKFEVEDFRIVATDTLPPDQYDETVTFLTTLFRRADGTHLAPTDLPVGIDDADPSRQADALLNTLHQAGVLGDQAKLPEAELAARQAAWDRHIQATDTELVDRRASRPVLGWLPDDVFYLRCDGAYDLLSGLVTERPAFFLRNLGPRTGLIIDLRRRPDRWSGERPAANDPADWMRALRLAGYLAEAPVTIVGYCGEEGFVVAPELADFVSPAANGDAGGVLLRAHPEEPWTDHGPIVVLTNPWSDVLTVLALNGRSGVTIVGEPARYLLRPGTQLEFLGGRRILLPTGVVTTPGGANVLMDGVAPDIAVPFDSVGDAVLARGLEILRRAR